MASPPHRPFSPSGFASSSNPDLNVAALPCLSASAELCAAEEGLERLHRGRNFFRTAQKCEMDRPWEDGHYSVKTFVANRDSASQKSDGPRMPSSKAAEPHRESHHKVETMKSAGQRDCTGDYGQRTEEYGNESSWYGERNCAGAATRSFGKQRGDTTRDSSQTSSASSEQDMQEAYDCRNSNKPRDGNDYPNVSPMRTHGWDSDATDELAKRSPSKDFGVDNDRTRMCKMSRNMFSDEEKDDTETKKSSPKHGHGAMQNEGNSRTWKTNSLSKAFGSGQNALEERKPPAQNPTSLFHIARSERDRGRREEPGKSRFNTAAPWDGFGEKLDNTDACLLDLEVAIEMEEAMDFDGYGMEESNQSVQVSDNLDITAAQSDDRHVEKDLEALVSPSSSTDKDGMEEGELKPEGEIGEEEGKELEEMELGQGRLPDTEMEEEGKVADHQDEIDVNVQLVEAHEMGGNRKPTYLRERRDHEEPAKMVDMNEDQESVRDKAAGNANLQVLQCGATAGLQCKVDIDKSSIGEQGTDHNTDLHLQCKASSIASISEETVTGNRFDRGSRLDLLHEKEIAEGMHRKSNISAREKSHDPGKELTLSLFTKPSGAGTKHKEGKSNMNGEFENGEKLQSVPPMQVRNSEKVVSGSAGELSESSSYGHKQKKLKIESLQLSLALPGSNPSTPAGPVPPHLDGLVEPEVSLQSLTRTETQTQNPSQTQTRTNSDGFTTSLSFSQSHSFVHNPSCSLNCTSVENQELSCGGSRQVSQGNEQVSRRSWLTPSGNEQLSNGSHGVTSLSQDRWRFRHGISPYQRVLQNGNVQINQGFPSVTGSNRSSGSNRISQRSHQIGQRLPIAPKIPDASLQGHQRSERQGSMQKDFTERPHQQEVWLASNQRVGFRETRSEPHMQLERDSLGDYAASPAKILGSLRNEDTMGGRYTSNGKVGLHEIATEPVTIMAQKLQELPDSFLVGLKDLAKDMLGSIEKREEFINLQGIIRRRMDLTEETLLHAHRTQLEILVALKTGIQVFVQEGTKPQTYKALIEIFLQTRCRNIDCQQTLPVNGCECAICSQKEGFCYECMCVVCSKFDTDNNTCRWVGCDVCLHWCHTDCGLRMSYIVPAPSGQGKAETSEMQFQCVGCGHYSELFGFIKAVFHSCARGWGAETLAKELDCVRRIFHGSKDMRGKQLCWKAEQMLQKLENKVDAAEVCRSMLRFFDEGNAELNGATTGTKKQPYRLKSETSNHESEIAEPVSKIPIAGSKLADLEKGQSGLWAYDKELQENRIDTGDLQKERAHKNDKIEELERIIRIKQAEAKMLQVRADEARQDAGGLQHIIRLKRERMEEGFASKYAKLRLNEAEEKRRKRFEELQALERAQHDYQRMKIRMEGDIKDLLMKMEMTTAVCFGRV